MEVILDIVRNDILSSFTIINDNFNSMKQEKILFMDFLMTLMMLY